MGEQTYSSRKEHRKIILEAGTVNRIQLTAPLHGIIIIEKIDENTSEYYKYTYNRLCKAILAREVKGREKEYTYEPVEPVPGTFRDKVFFTLNKLTDDGADVLNIIETLSGVKNDTITIAKAAWNSHIATNINRLSWTPYGGIITVRKKKQAPAIGLLHELGHAYIAYCQFLPPEKQRKLIGKSSEENMVLTRKEPQISDYVNNRDPGKPKDLQAITKDYQDGSEEYAKWFDGAGRFHKREDEYIIQYIENKAVEVYNKQPAVYGLQGTRDEHEYCYKFKNLIDDDKRGIFSILPEFEDPSHKHYHNPKCTNPLRDKEKYRVYCDPLREYHRPLCLAKYNKSERAIPRE